MEIIKHIKEILNTPVYRTNPQAIFQYTYAKWLYRKYRVYDPLLVLKHLNIDKKTAMDGYGHWEALLLNCIIKINNAEGHQGAISINDGIVLYGVVRALKPDIVIETGVAAGLSTSFISAALLENGKGNLYSIELPEAESRQRTHLDGATFDWPHQGVGWVIPKRIKEAMGERHTLILEDVKTALPKLIDQLGGVDVFLHDDLHTPEHTLWEYRLIWPHLNASGVLLSDDVNFGWLKFLRELGRKNNDCLNIERLAAIRK